MKLHIEIQWRKIKTMKNDMKLQGKVVFVIGLFVICLFLQACNKVNCPGCQIGNGYFGIHLSGKKNL